MRRPSHVVLVLLAALLSLVPLHLLAAPVTPGALASVEWARGAAGLLGALFLPGLAIAPLLLGRDLVKDDRLHVGWWLLAGFGLNVFVQVLHLNGLRLIGVPREWPALVALTAVETVLALLLQRARLPRLALARPSVGLAGGTGIVLSLLAVFWIQAGPELTVDSSWNYYSDVLADGIDRPARPGSLAFVRATAGPTGQTVLWEPGEAFVLPGSRLRLVVNNGGPDPQDVPIVFLVHGPVGTHVELRIDGEVAYEATIDRLVPVAGIDKPVERYWRHGVAAALGIGHTPPAGQAIAELEVRDAQGAVPPPGTIRVLEWSGLSADELIVRVRQRGVRFMPPFQLLNVTENVRWADEVADDYVLSGRSPDGLSTLHQPPGWTYQLAPARRLITEHTLTASLILFVVLAMIGLTSLLAVEAAATALPTGAALLLAVGVGGNALQHARLMVSDGSMNFPDSMYALALLACGALLVTGRTRTFMVWALLATVLRYPGAVVVGLGALSLAILRPDLRRRVMAMAMRFSLVVAVFCGVMLVIAVMTGVLETWLFALWFETVPEHFNNNDEALPLLRRPLEFARLWALFGGGVLLLAAPVRGTTARVFVATAVLYAPFLAFIDHFSHHYFLPLIALASAGTAASIAETERPALRMGVAAAFAVGSLALLGAAGALGL